VFFVWKENMRIDGGVIDGDHKHLIDIMDGVMILVSNKASQGAVMAMMTTLLDFAEKHFEREEALQKISGYPDAPAHKEKHARLINDLKVYISNVSSTNCAELTPQQCKERLQETKRFLTRWLIAHILGEDVKLRPYALQMSPLASTMTTLRKSA